MSEQEERERAGLLFRVSQLHYLIVDRNQDLQDHFYPVIAKQDDYFANLASNVDSMYKNNIRAHERIYFDAVKELRLDELRAHVVRLENKLSALDGNSPDGKTGYIKYQSYEKYSTYNIDLTYRAKESRLYMVFEIVTVNNLAGSNQDVYRIEKDYPASNNVENLVPGIDKPKYFNNYFYYPVSFPNGTWNLLTTEFREHKYFQAIIRTDACVTVKKYENFPVEIRDEITGAVVDISDNWKEVGTVSDSGYLIHGGGSNVSDIYSPIDYNDYQDRTIGCIRMKNDDIREIIPYVDASLISKGRNLLHVEP